MDHTNIKTTSCCFVTYLFICLIYLITPRSRVFLEKLKGFQLVMIFPAFNGTPKVHYRIHKCPPPALSWTRPIQSLPPRSTCWRYTLIISSHTYLGLPSGLFPSSFPIKTLYTCYMPSPFHSSRIDHPKNKYYLFIFYYFLWHCSPARAMASSFSRFRDHTQRKATAGRTALDE
jgi:hypothetical protein